MNLGFVVALGILSALPWPSLAAVEPRAADVPSLVAAFSGHLAVLPAPGVGGLVDSPAGRTLIAQGLAPHITELSPTQFADTNFFDARRFPIAFHLGFEAYYQTVHQAGDGDVALRQFLAGGGTLLVLPHGPFPMYYNQLGQPANGAAVIGLNIGAGGFEGPPPGSKLFFQANTNQSLFSWPESRSPFPSAYEADLRWRPSRPPGRADIRYTPLVTLFDAAGHNLGDGAAGLEFVQDPLRGGRVLFIWGSLLAPDARRDQVMRDVVGWALRDRPPPRNNQLRDDFEGRDQVTADGALWMVQAGQWKLEAGTLVGQDCVADGYEVQGATRGNAEWRDGVFTVRFKIESRGSDWRDGPWFGVHTRPNGDGYYLTFTDRDCQLHKVIYGMSTREHNALAATPWKPDNQWHMLRIETVANQIHANLDGRSLIRVKDDSHLNMPSLRRGAITLAARKGSRSSGNTVVRFDDLEVRLREAK